MPSTWSKIRDEWLDRTAVSKDNAKWALEALINSEEESVSYTHLTLPTIVCV